VQAFRHRQSSRHALDEEMGSLPDGTSTTAGSNEEALISVSSPPSLSDSNTSASIQWNKWSRPYQLQPDALEEILRSPAASINQLYPVYTNVNSVAYMGGVLFGLVPGSFVLMLVLRAYFPHDISWASALMPLVAIGPVGIAAIVHDRCFRGVMNKTEAILPILIFSLALVTTTLVTLAADHIWPVPYWVAFLPVNAMVACPVVLSLKSTLSSMCDLCNCRSGTRELRTQLLKDLAMLFAISCIFVTLLIFPLSLDGICNPPYTTMAGALLVPTGLAWGRELSGWNSW